MSTARRAPPDPPGQPGTTTHPGPEVRHEVALPMQGRMPLYATALGIMEDSRVLSSRRARGHGSAWI